MAEKQSEGHEPAPTEPPASAPEPEQPSSESVSTAGEQTGRLPDSPPGPPDGQDRGPPPESELSVPGSAAITPFPIVGIGASAGGLAALKQLFAHVPENSGLAFVVVVHLSPEHESLLAELLQPHTKIPVQQVTETVRLEKNRVYVIPPNANLDSIDTHLRLSELEQRRQERAPIDHFFRTLARTHDGRAVGIVLTGTGSDGTLGLREIKEKTGLAIVQDPKEAEYDGMPQSAIASGMVDWVLPLAEIPAAVLRYAGTHPRLPALREGEPAGDRDSQLLQKIFAQLRARTGRDFSRYKRSTILRRIHRRMQLHHIEELSGYLDRLREQREEIRLLADELLITVTSFFRDPEVFAALEKDVIPRLFDEKDPNDQLRVWAVGCATGEEAYSLAMLLLEEAARRESTIRLQVFASDLHEYSLTKAREGFYPGDIEADVSSERLRRFFIQEKGGYRLGQEAREVVVFAPHNLLGDPPFSRIDLITCRNLLIYIDREAQRDVAALFHYALRPDGFLLLGGSESVDAADLFHTVDKKHCIYRKRNVPAPEPRLPVFPLHHRQVEEETGKDRQDEPLAYSAMHQRMVEQYAPPSLLVNPDNKVVHLSEHVGKYLVHSGGEPTTSVFRLVREELRIELRTSLHTVRRRGITQRSKPIPVRFNGKQRPVVLDIRPALEPQQDGFVLVIFDERPSAALLPEPTAASPPEPTAPRLPESPAEPPRPPESASGGEADRGASEQQLRAELDRTRRQLQTVIEEYETSEEEMKASNEELQSANEELRSTMEELETSKEELQSTNEELQAVNQENRHKVEELGQLSADLQNLLTATDIATLFLDRDLRILRFTPKVGELFNVRAADRGRPIADLTHHLGYDQLQQDATQVLRQLVPSEREVQDEAGRWYLTRVMPYRSAEDQIQGVVITFVDMTQRKETEQAIREAKYYAEQIIETLPEPLLVLTPELIVKSANAAFYDHFQVAPAVTEGRRIYELGDGQWDVPGLRKLLEEVLPSNDVFNGYQIEHEFEHLGPCVMLLNGRRLDHMQLILLGIHDITDRKQAEEALKDADRRKDEFLATLAHELRNPLAPIRMGLELMKGAEDDPEAFEEIRSTMERQTQQLLMLVDDLLDVSRITRGKLELRRGTIELSEVVRSAVEASQPLIDDFGHQFTLDLPAQPIYLDADPNRLAQVLSNLLNNAAKYTPSGGKIWLSAERRGDDLRISVNDTGIGIPAEMLEQIFTMFAQVDTQFEQGASGLGIGLTLVKSLVEMHGGRIEIHSEGRDRGSEFIVHLPVRDGPQAETPATPKPAEQPAADHRRVLIADDNQAAVQMARRMLEKLGHEVRTAKNGRETVQLAEQFRPHLVLMDLGMPQLNGYEAAKQIRAQPWGKTIVLAALTGWGQEKDRSRTHDAGFDHHLVKPADPATLRRVLDEVSRKAT